LSHAVDLAPPPRPPLRLLGPVTLSRRGSADAGWPYAKLPALLAVLADAGSRPLRRDWLAALLWPERDAASLRRALYDLRRQLQPGVGGAAWVGATRDALWLTAALPTDLSCLDAAERSLQAGVPDLPLARRALVLWQGEFAAGLVVPGADDFALWLMQARAHWERRALRLAMAVAERLLHDGQAGEALAVARSALDRVPDAEAARALVWRCQVATGARLQAVQDVRRWQTLQAGQGLAPSAALQAAAADLGLAAAPAAAAQALPPELALAETLAQVLRQGPAGQPLEDLLEHVPLALAPGRGAAVSATQVLVWRRGLMLRLMHAPWQLPMSRLAAAAESLLCRPLADADRLDIVQTLATWHGWMGRGVRGEVLLRSLGALPRSATPAAAVRWEMTLALCHSCSTGDPERSIRAARRGLKLAREGAVPGCANAFWLLEANAAMNRGAPGDAPVARRALARAGRAEPLLRFDLVNHHQLSAQWQLLHGDAALALAEAEQGARMAQAVPFPLQGLSCALLVLQARLLLGEPAAPLAPRMDEALQLARRIGSQGYLMNALFVAAALSQRLGDRPGAARQRDEARAIARACGVQRLRKIAPGLLQEALVAA
jgi:DNA-binding SARP family transcriptional activator